MPAELWSRYGEAIKLILNGYDKDPLTLDQRKIFLNMLSIRRNTDTSGNIIFSRELPSVRTQIHYAIENEIHDVNEKGTEDLGEEKDAQKERTESNKGYELVYYIPDLFRFMVPKFDEWDIDYPPVNIKYLKSIKHELGKKSFFFVDSSNEQTSISIDENKKYWELLCKSIEIKQRLSDLSGTRHEGDPLKVEAQMRMRTKLNDELIMLREKMGGAEEDLYDTSSSNEITQQIDTISKIEEIAEIQDTHLLAIFRSMKNLKFQDIKFVIDPDNLVLRISAKGKQATASFSTIGLLKKNEITLNKQGEIFMAMANRNFNVDKPGNKNAIGRLSASLREAFSTPDTPFCKYEHQFKLSIPKDREAKKRGLKGTTTYDDKIKKPEEMSAQEYLEEHDPNFDRENPIYSDDSDTDTSV